MEQVEIKGWREDLPLSSIHVAEENARSKFRREAISQLADSIRSINLIHPVIVIQEGPNNFKLIAGQRRFFAFEELGRQTIPALIIEPVDSATQRVISLGENLQRRELHFSEAVDACSALFDEYKGTKARRIRKIATELGVGDQTVRTYIAGRLVPPLVRTWIDQRLISRQRALRLTAAHWPDEKKIIELADRIRRMTKPEADRLIEAGERRPGAPINALVDEALTAPTTVELTIHLPVETRDSLQRLAEEEGLELEEFIQRRLNHIAEESKGNAGKR